MRTKLIITVFIIFLFGRNGSSQDILQASSDILKEIRSEFDLLLSEMKSLSNQANIKIRVATEKISNATEAVRSTPTEAKKEISVTKEANTAISFISPIQGDYRISSEYGYRKDPFTRKRAFHKGIDIPVPHNTPIYASLDGVILKAEHDKSGGRFILIIHENNYQTLYAHLSQFKVRKGEKVKKGEIIGYSGNTGRSTGPHLHYQVYSNEKTINPLLVLINKTR